MKPVNTNFVKPKQIASFLDPQYKELPAETNIQVEKIKTYVQQEIIFASSNISTCRNISAEIG